MADVETKKNGQKVGTGEAVTEKRSEPDFQQRVAKISEKVGQAVKRGSQRVAKFTGSATRLSKLKMDIHNLQNQLDKVRLESGKKLWQMHQDNKLGQLDMEFSQEFDQIAKLEKQIRAKEKEAESISLVE